LCRELGKEIKKKKEIEDELERTKSFTKEIIEMNEKLIHELGHRLLNPTKTK